VLLNGDAARKACTNVGADDVLALDAGFDTHYVGRGAHQLLGALDTFGIDVNGLVCVDIGASTGGFTQVLLERGAVRVFAVDVGSGQLAPCLAEDPRVVNLEQCDARMARQRVGAPVDFLCADVSFISLRLLYPRLLELLGDAGQAVCLLKPQFEAGPRDVGKGGLVKDVQVHTRVLAEAFAAAQGAGFCVCGAVHSPIAGGEGNIEYLLHLRKGAAQAAFDRSRAAQIARNAREAFG
jgi:23S rRNA (cytidine1920-2'-O)/16S rRNA (cytidine1409-2'-O)-methyltransferase